MSTNTNAIIALKNAIETEIDSISDIQLILEWDDLESCIDRKQLIAFYRKIKNQNNSDETSLDAKDNPDEVSLSEFLSPTDVLLLMFETDKFDFLPPKAIKLLRTNPNKVNVFQLAALLSLEDIIKIKEITHNRCPL
jgi:hypothetical protein